jgi:hypothetical protein
MKIYIPTYMREGRQFTIQSIPERWKTKTFLVCPHWEEHPYWPDAQRVDVGRSAIGSIAATRQWIVEFANDRHILMVDDDIRFYRINSDKRTSRTKLDDAGEVFDLMEKWLEEGDVFVGTSHPFMSHEKPPEYFYGKTAACYGMDREFLIGNNIRYDSLGYFEDFHVPLSILEAGRRLRYTGDYVTDEKKANAPGGCSVNRTAEKNRQGMIDLQKLHPKYVSLTEDPTATNQGLNVGLKMRIAFKKAYDENVNVSRLSFD